MSGQTQENTDPDAQAPRISISWLWATVALAAALLFGLGVGNAIASDDEARTLANERADRIQELNRQIDRLEQRTASISSVKATTTTSSTGTTTASTAPAAALAPVATTVVPTPIVTPPPAAPSSSSTYFANCTAARAAGAAPVHVGDPGYGRHLDRDGDGVGCE